MRRGWWQRQIENWVKAKLHFGQSWPADNSTHSRYHRRPRHPNHWMKTFGSFLIECVCISQQLAGMGIFLEQLHLSFTSSQPLPPTGFPSGFYALAPCFPQVFAFKVFFSLNFTAVFAHYSEFCIFLYLFARNALSSGSNKQALPCLA